MDILAIKHIQEELRRLNAIVGNWREDAVPAVERDLVLAKLRALYDRVLFAENTAALDGRADDVNSNSNVVEDIISISLDDVLLETPHEDVPTHDGDIYGSEFMSEPDPESVPASEIQSGPASDIESEIKPDAVSDAKQEPALMPEYGCDVEPELPSEFDTEPESEPAPDTDHDAGTESGLEPLREPFVDSEVEADPAANETEAVAIENQVAEAARQEKERQRKKTEDAKLASLFDVDGMVIRRSEKRRVIMSLYETDEDKTVVREETVAVRPQIGAHDNAVSDASTADLHREAETISAASGQVSSHGQPADVAGPGDDAEYDGEDEITIVEIETKKENVVRVVESAPREISHVLGETMNNDVMTIADTIVRPKDAVSEILRGESSDLRGMIGINDRFLLIRDLFGGDTAAYDATITRLDGFGDLDDCMIYIAENFEWNPNSDGAKLIMELLERKLG